MRFLAVIGAFAIAVALAAAAFFFGGFYNIAANAHDPAVVDWALVKVRTAAIASQAKTQPPAGYDTPEKVQAGARAFSAQGCANCHGAPGVKWAKFSEGLNPDPPDLKEVAAELPAAQMFWVIRNGIRMTGMPSFNAAGASDEDIWSIVAFVKKIPVVTEADYAAWTSPAPKPQ